MGSSVTMTLDYYKLILDGKTMVEIDRMGTFTLSTVKMSLRKSGTCVNHRRKAGWVIRLKMKQKRKAQKQKKIGK
ncbi:hypothetical protein [Enterocloster sp.]|uniref:hypothetical protein n=1 Tax=Enterocloster sp. TaxID=2719315 RepID=UPI0039A160E8